MGTTIIKVVLNYGTWLIMVESIPNQSTVSTKQVLQYIRLDLHLGRDKNIEQGTVQVIYQYIRGEGV